MELLITGGIGDIFAVESLLTDQERTNLRGIYYATRAYGVAKMLFEAVPSTFPKLKRHVLLSSSEKVYYSKAEVENDFGPIRAQDGSILKLFKENRTYNGSTFLKHRLANITPPERYVVICPMSATGGSPKERNFDCRDWFYCMKVLKKFQLKGVVLYQGEGSIPCHDDIINLQNKTNILQSIEYLKFAEGYVGVDSCLSVLAAKLHKMLCVKTINQHCLIHKSKYFAPRQDFSFLRSTVEPKFKAFL